jgi:ribonuclease P protein component
VERRFRLTKDSDFKRVRQSGKTYSHPLLVLIVLENEHKISRVGVITRKSLGNAVKRNRIRRQMKACMALMMPLIKGNWDMIMIPRSAMSGSDFSTIRSSLIDVIHRSGLLEKNE